MRPAAPLLAFAILVAASAARAQDAPNLAVASDDGVRSFNSEDIPTFKIADDGTVDGLISRADRRHHPQLPRPSTARTGEASSHALVLKQSLPCARRTYDGLDSLGAIVAEAGRTRWWRQRTRRCRPSSARIRTRRCHPDVIRDSIPGASVPTLFPGAGGEARGERKSEASPVRLKEARTGRDDARVSATGLRGAARGRLVVAQAAIWSMFRLRVCADPASKPLSREDGSGAPGPALLSSPPTSRWLVESPGLLEASAALCGRRQCWELRRGHRRRPGDGALA